MASLNNHPRVDTKIDLEKPWFPLTKRFQSWWMRPKFSDIAEGPMTPNFSREWKPRLPTETQPEWMPQRMLTFRRNTAQQLTTNWHITPVSLVNECQSLTLSLKLNLACLSRINWGNNTLSNLTFSGGKPPSTTYNLFVSCAAAPYPAKLHVAGPSSETSG